MKVKYIEESNPLELINGKVYEVIEQEKLDGEIYFRVIDETGEDYLYEAECFEVVEK